MRVITNKKKTGRKTIFSIGFFNAAPKKKKKTTEKIVLETVKTRFRQNSLLWCRNNIILETQNRLVLNIQ